MRSRASVAIRCLSALIGCAILLGLFIGPVTPYFRFAGKLIPYGEGIFKRSGPIDVVFIGTSRTFRSVSAESLEPLLSDRLKRPVVVYDLGKPGQGSDVDYLLLEEIMKRSQVKLVVIEYSSGLQGANHYFFIQNATWKRLFDAALVHDDNLKYFTSLIRKKLEIFMTVAAKSSLFKPPALSASTASSLDFTLPRGPIEYKLRNAIGRERAPVDLPLGEPENIVQDAFIRKSIVLAKAHGSKVVLTMIPGLFQRGLTQTQRMRLADYFGVDVIGLDDDDLKNFSAHDYSDERHHGGRALKIYSPLLARWLAPMLAPRADGGAS